jgi:hypothetical protein
LPVAFLFYDGDAFDYSGEVLYAGGVSGSVAGLLQVKLRVPTKLAEAEGGNFVFFIGSHWERQTMALR